MKSLPAFLLVAGLAGQGVAVFPSDYVNVPEGPYDSQYLPLAWGVSRVMFLYDAFDVQVPAGAQIHRLGFREDRTITWPNAGRTLQLQVRMGFSNFDHANASYLFDQNYATTPVTVFGPAAFALPDLRNPALPLADGKFWIPLTTPFLYQPNGRNLVVEFMIYGTSGGGGAFDYYLDRADFHSPVASGPAGCVHLAGGPPELTIDPTAVGSYFQARAAQAPPNSLSVLLFAVGTQLLPSFPLDPIVRGIDPTCRGQIPLTNPLPLIAISDAWGNAWWSFYLGTNTAMLNDLYLACQGAFFDFFAPGGIVVSNGYQVQIGLRPQSTAIYNQGPPLVTTTGYVYPNYCPVAYFDYQ